MISISQDVRAVAASAPANWYSLSSGYFFFSFFLFLFSLSVSLGFFLPSLLTLSFFPLSPMSTSFELDWRNESIVGRNSE